MVLHLHSHLHWHLRVEPAFVRGRVEGSDDNADLLPRPCVIRFTVKLSGQPARIDGPCTGTRRHGEALLRD
jgi:hypothetical protein